jgi:hydrogenase large subunit
MVLKTLDVPVTALFSTLGRTAARGLEGSWAAHKMKYFFDQLMTNLKAGDFATANVERWDPSTWPAEARGVAPCEAPRGALAHWVKIKNTKIESYQCVVPTTWNVCPRDDNGVRGPIEEALVGTLVANAEKPLEVLRVVHSFDPCLACTVHVIHPESNRIMDFKVG